MKAIEFMPEGAKYKWDNIEIHPVQTINKGGEAEINGEYNTTCVEDKDADFFTVYLRGVTAGLNCIADLPTRAQAEQFADMLRSAVLNYKEQGYMDGKY